MVIETRSNFRERRSGQANDMLSTYNRLERAAAEDALLQNRYSKGQINQAIASLSIKPKIQKMQDFPPPEVKKLIETQIKKMAKHMDLFNESEQQSAKITKFQPKQHERINRSDNSPDHHR